MALNLGGYTAARAVLDLDVFVPRRGATDVEYSTANETLA